MVLASRARARHASPLPFTIVAPYPKSRLHHRSRVALLAAAAAHRLPRVAPKPNAALRRRYGVLVVLCAFQLSRIVYFKHSLSSYQVTPPAVLCSAAWRTRSSAPCVPRASAATTKRAAAAAGGGAQVLFQALILAWSLQRCVLWLIVFCVGKDHNSPFEARRPPPCARAVQCGVLAAVRCPWSLSWCGEGRRRLFCRCGSAWSRTACRRRSSSPSSPSSWCTMTPLPPTDSPRFPRS